MDKQWRYRNGDKPFGVAKIELPDGGVSYVSVTKSGRLVTHRPNGTLQAFANDGFDLIPYEPYSDFKIDDKVHGWNEKPGQVESGHFAGLTDDGRPTTFHWGGTSFTRLSLQRNAWNFCEKADKEDK
jgi:hypothetical protein